MVYKKRFEDVKLADCTIKDCKKQATQIIMLGSIKNYYCGRCFEQVSKKLEKEQRHYNP